MLFQLYALFYRLSFAARRRHFSTGTQVSRQFKLKLKLWKHLYVHIIDYKTRLKCSQMSLMNE